MRDWIACRSGLVQGVQYFNSSVPLRYDMVTFFENAYDWHTASCPSVHSLIYLLYLSLWCWCVCLSLWLDIHMSVLTPHIIGNSIFFNTYPGKQKTPMLRRITLSFSLTKGQWWGTRPHVMTSYYYAAWRHNVICVVGVDFQVRSLMVDEHLLAMQLWDTAGQERWAALFVLCTLTHSVFGLGNILR